MPNDERPYTCCTLEPANQNNERGKRTWEWKQSDGRQISVYHRFKDEVFASHFHKGEDPAKNPELFLLLRGVMFAEFMDKNGNTWAKALDATHGPVKLIIQPWVLHRMKALEECLYIEYRPRFFNPENPDTYPEKEFPRQFDYPIL